MDKMWNETMIESLKEQLPHGSGINGDWNIEVLKTIPNRFHCHNCFSAMNENGMYCHHYDFTVVVDYLSGFEFVRLEFNDRLMACGWGLREYLEETISYALGETK